jgi:hypothetical protein
VGDTDGSRFRGILCSQLFFLSCNNFTFSFGPVADLSSVNPKPSLDADGHIVGPTFNAGDPEDLVVVTIVYVHSFIVPYVGSIFGDDGLNDPHKRAITSFLVIKNEPFPN